MGNKRKIFNDPVYGLISFKHEIIYDIINHPLFQRLRRISQMGLASIVYPGAVHTRFQHALGALHLMTRAITLLRNKDIEITESEYEAVCIAILLHDIGHGPFSHALERLILPIHHEDISLRVMKTLNREFKGRLDLAILIFENKYHKKFLHELVSGQVDMDRLDYLNRDSFYSGVAEGVIGFDRIIQMLHVHQDRLVVEEKGIYSIEKFLMARRIMYWQVYLHKTALAAEQMLRQFILELRHQINQHAKELKYSRIVQILSQASDPEMVDQDQLINYGKIDDWDVYILLKHFQSKPNGVLSYWADNLLKRKLPKIILSDMPFSRDFVDELRQKISNELGFSPDFVSKILIMGQETTTEYQAHKDEIFILRRDGDIKPYSEIIQNHILTNVITKHFLCYPKIKN